MIIFIKSDNCWKSKDADQMLKQAGWLSEQVGKAGRHISEKLFEHYRQQMEVLRETDQSIRDWTKDLDSCLKAAAVSFDQEKWMDTIYWISQINSRLKLVSGKANTISAIPDQGLEDYYSQSEYPISENYFDESKLAQAGIMDWLGQRHLKKMYAKRFAEQKIALRTLLAKTKIVVGNVDFRLKKMAKFRNVGDVDSYSKELSAIASEQLKFEGEFTTIFNKYFKQVADKMLANQAKKQEEQKQNVPDLKNSKSPSIDISAPEIPNLELPAFPIKQTELPSIMEENEPIYGGGLKTNPGLDNGTLATTQIQTPGATLPIPKEEIENKPSLITKAPVVEEAKIKTKKNKKNEKNEKEEIKKSHWNFFQELNKVSSKQEAGMKLLAYSEYLENVDLEQSLQILALAEGFLEE